MRDVRKLLPVVVEKEGNGHVSNIQPIGHIRDDLGHGARMTWGKRLRGLSTQAKSTRHLADDEEASSTNRTSCSAFIVERKPRIPEIERVPCVIGPTDDRKYSWVSTL